jgi:hypothetical protein
MCAYSPYTWMWSLCLQAYDCFRPPSCSLCVFFSFKGTRAESPLIPPPHGLCVFFLLLKTRPYSQGDIFGLTCRAATAPTAASAAGAAAATTTAAAPTAGGTATTKAHAASGSTDEAPIEPEHQKATAAPNNTVQGIGPCSAAPQTSRGLPGEWRQRRRDRRVHVGRSCGGRR